jgi:hypothetical protein
MLEKIHKVSEIVAAFAIVGSLIFVGLQLGQNTQAVEAQEDDSAYASWFTLNQMVVSTPDFADILVRGQSGGLEVLSQAENIRFSQYHYGFFTAWEQNYRTWIRDPEIWDVLWLRAMIDEAIKIDEGVNNKGSRELWAQSKNFYTREFVAWVDQNSSEK